MKEPKEQPFITIRLTRDLHKRLRLQCVKDETTTQDFVSGLIADRMKQLEAAEMEVNA